MSSSSQRSSRRMLATLAVALTVMSLTVGAPPGTASPASGSEPDNPYVVDPVAQVNRIPSRPDAIGWNFASGDGGPRPTQCKHWQGLQRSYAPGTQYLFVSRNGNAGVCDPAGPGGQLDDFSGDLSIIEFGSRDQTGERWRSNRLQKDTDIEDTPPRPEDRRVATIGFDGTAVVGDPDNETWPHYQHPGGMQLVGDVLAVPLEGPVGANPENLILFLDVSNPLQPTILSRLNAGHADDHISGLSSSDWGAGLVAVAKLEDGRYLLVTTGKDNKMLRFFISNGTDLRDTSLTWSHFLDVTESTIEAQIGPDWPAGDVTGDAHQMMNFIRSGPSNGELYLLGARNTQPSSAGGKDFIDLYRTIVDVDAGTIQFVHATSRHLDTHANLTEGTLGSGNIANLRAAGGAYVSPTGELIFYASEHDNTGPGAAGSVADSVNAGEWRSIDMVRPDSPTLNPTADAGGPYAATEGGSVALNGAGSPPITQAWVELFADEDYGSPFAVIDYPDRTRDSWNNFDDLDGEETDPDNFGDDATAARWFAPVGCTIVLNHESYSTGEPSGDKRVLPSIGASDPYPGRIRHLGGDDNAISSVTFRPNCDDYYAAAIDVAWDLDGDSTFEAAGASQTLSLATVDGPATLSRGFQASHPTDGRAGLDDAVIEVANVPPLLSAAGAFDPTGAEIGVDVPVTLAGIPVTVRASFTDPGVADTQSASIDWGDGIIEQWGAFDSFRAATGGVVGHLEHAHLYAPGSYEIRATVTDDDGGAAEITRTIQVLSAEEALELVVEQIDELLSGANTAKANRELLRARDAITGHTGGLGADGALDELDKGNLVAAMRKIRLAIDALVGAEAAGAGDLSQQKDLLTLAGYAIAQDTLTKAEGATPSPTRPEQARLDEAGARIAEGVARLATNDHLAAQDAFSRAVELAAPMCGCT